MRHLKRFETFFLSPELEQPKDREYLDEIENIESPEEEITKDSDLEGEFNDETSTQPDTQVLDSDDEMRDKEDSNESKKDKPVSYKKSGLKRPNLADRNKNKKIEGWEKTIAKKIEKSIEDRKKK
jgi:hypothetical protein